METEQRRRRKRTAKHLHYSLTAHYFSVRSLLWCFAFMAFLYLLSTRIHTAQSAFRPVFVLSNLQLLSQSAIFNRLLSSSPLKVDDRILFPDHIMLMVSSKNVKGNEFECVYSKNHSKNYIDSGLLKRNALGVDVYDQFQMIVRCPLPPENFSAAVKLEARGGNGIRHLTDNRTVHSWEMVAYAAALDGDTAVVFVKGLNLRADRESDRTQFSCHFGLGDWEREGRYVMTTKAISAAQEVVRCPLPRSIRMNPSKAQGLRVTVGVTPRVRNRTRDRLLVPSVAKVLNFKSEEWEKKMKRREEKNELCACTMVWNQAPALREWITYHAWLGIERWFIYDNNSEDGIKEAIDKLEVEGYNVSRHAWPWIKTQEAGFSHCALRARDECKWVAFMDVDEFFYFPYPNVRNQGSREWGFPGQNSLRTLVTNFSSSTTIREIRTACHSFGPSGLSSPPSQGVTAGYTCRLQSPERHKSIVRPDALDITLLNAVHHFHLEEGFGYLNLPQSTAVINHYKYQVWESFRAKFFRRVATYVADWQENQNEGSRDRAPGLGTEAIEPPNWRLQFCEVWDTGLRDFVTANLADPATGLLPWEKTSL